MFLYLFFISLFSLLETQAQAEPPQITPEEIKTILFSNREGKIPVLQFFERLKTDSRFREEVNEAVQKDSKLKKWAERGLRFRQQYINLRDEQVPLDNAQTIIAPIADAVENLNTSPALKENRAEKKLPEEQILKNAIADTVKHLNLWDELILLGEQAGSTKIASLNDVTEEHLSKLSSTHPGVKHHLKKRLHYWNNYRLPGSKQGDISTQNWIEYYDQKLRDALTQNFLVALRFAGSIMPKRKIVIRGDVKAGTKGEKFVLKLADIVEGKVQLKVTKQTKTPSSPEVIIIETPPELKHILAEASIMLSQRFGVTSLHNLGTPNDDPYDMLIYDYKFREISPGEVRLSIRHIDGRQLETVISREQMIDAIDNLKKSIGYIGDHRRPLDFEKNLQRKFLKDTSSRQKKLFSALDLLSEHKESSKKEELQTIFHKRLKKVKEYHDDQLDNLSSYAYREGEQQPLDASLGLFWGGLEKDPSYWKTKDVKRKWSKKNIFYRTYKSVARNMILTMAIYVISLATPLSIVARKMVPNIKGQSLFQLSSPPAGIPSSSDPHISSQKSMQAKAQVPLYELERLKSQDSTTSRTVLPSYYTLPSTNILMHDEVHQLELATLEKEQTEFRLHSSTPLEADSSGKVALLAPKNSKLTSLKVFSRDGTPLHVKLFQLEKTGLLYFIPPPQFIKSSFHIEAGFKQIKPPQRWTELNKLDPDKLQKLSQLWKEAGFELMSSKLDDVIKNALDSKAVDINIDQLIKVIEKNSIYTFSEYNEGEPLNINVPSDNPFQSLSQYVHQVTSWGNTFCAQCTGFSRLLRKSLEVVLEDHPEIVITESIGYLKDNTQDFITLAGYHQYVSLHKKNEVGSLLLDATSPGAFLSDSNIPPENIKEKRKNRQEKRKDKKPRPNHLLVFLMTPREEKQFKELLVEQKEQKPKANDPHLLRLKELEELKEVLLANPALKSQSTRMQLELPSARAIQLASLLKNYIEHQISGEELLEKIFTIYPRSAKNILEVAGTQATHLDLQDILKALGQLELQRLETILKKVQHNRSHRYYFLSQNNLGEQIKQLFSNIGTFNWKSDYDRETCFHNLIMNNNP